jgi:hypothetical protein
MISECKVFTDVRKYNNFHHLSHYTYTCILHLGNTQQCYEDPSKLFFCRAAGETIAVNEFLQHENIL